MKNSGYIGQTALIQVDLIHLGPPAAFYLRAPDGRRADDVNPIADAAAARGPDGGLRRLLRDVHYRQLRVRAPPPVHLLLLRGAAPVRAARQQATTRVRHRAISTRGGTTRYASTRRNYVILENIRLIVLSITVLVY